MKIKWPLLIVIFILLAVFFLKINETPKEAPIKIGVLTVGDIRFEKLKGLKKGLMELGYRQSEFEFRIKNSKEDTDLLKKQANELIKMKPKIIVTLGAIETVELKKIMDEKKVNIPVVFAGVASPKELGIIQDETNPGGMFTGVNNYNSGISAKRIEILRDLLPTIHQVHVLYDENTEISKLSLKETMETAKVLSIPCREWNVAEPFFYENLKKDLKKNDAILVLPGFRIESMADSLASLSNQKKIPLMGIYEFEVRKGFLASYGTSLDDQGYQAARYVSLIMKGNSPAHLPVEYPDQIRFIMNKNVQESLGVPLNPNLLNLAEFIESGKGSRK